MSSEILTYIFLGGGLALVAAELFIPGAVLGFLGAGALLVAAARWMGLVEDLGPSIGAWLVVSLAMLIFLRGFIQRLSGAERSAGSSSEDADAFGADAIVIERVVAGEDGGRVRFHGTTWPARCLHGVLEPGVEVRIVDRDNFAYVVEPKGILPPPKPPGA